MSNAFSKLGRQTDRPAACHASSDTDPLDVTGLEITPSFLALQPNETAFISVSILRRGYQLGTSILVEFQGVDSVPPQSRTMALGIPEDVEIIAPTKPGSHWLSATCTYPDGFFSVAYTIIRVRPNS